MTCTTRDRPENQLRALTHRGPGLQGADVMIAQRVEDVLELLPGRGHGTDVAAAPGGDPVPHPTHLGVSGQHLDRLHRRPADQTRALLGDPAAVHVGVGFVVLGRQPGPAGQLRLRW